jgi:O-antigen ligase
MSSVRTNVAIAAVLALTPLLILPGCFFSYDITPKIVVALTGAAIALLLFLREWRAIRVCRWFCALAFAQILSLLLSTLFSTHPALSWNGGNWRRLGFVSQTAVIVLALLVAATYSEFGLRIWLRATAVSGTLTALYGILQYFGIDPFLSPATYQIGDGVTTIVRPPSTLGHADYFAGYLLYVVFLGVALAATESKTGWNILGAGAALAGSIAIVLSGTRGAMLGLASGAILLLIWKRPRLTRGHVVLASALCATGLVFYLSPAGLKLRARSQWAAEDLRGGARLWLWRDSLRMAGQRLLVGYGPDTFGLEFPRYQSVGLAQAYPDFYHESPHNILLDALVSQGLPGLAVLIGFAVLAWSYAPTGQAYVGAALLAGVVSGFFVCFTLPGELYFFATVALLAGAATKASRADAGVPPIGVSFAALLLTCLLLYSAAQVTASDVALQRAKHDLEAKQIEESLKAYARSQRWHPAGSSDDLYFSRALAAAASWKQAFLVAQRATQTSEERQNAWFNLAGFYSTLNDYPGVELCLRRSIQASPAWFKPHWVLAQMLQLAGRRPEALREAARAAELDGGKDREITHFLQTLHHSPASAEPK